jgi:hypothetical protein
MNVGPMAAPAKAESMTREAGVWIDHRKAVIAILAGQFELEERLGKEALRGRIVGVETVDKMTDRQVAARVRQRFLKSKRRFGKRVAV